MHVDALGLVREPLENRIENVESGRFNR